MSAAPHEAKSARGGSATDRDRDTSNVKLWPSEAAVSDVVGRLIEFWGFKRNMGRIWTLLYLSPDPLSAEDLRRLLGLSTGAVSMTLTDLARWGVVRKIWVQGERRDFYAAEVQLWRMISRVWSEREKVEVDTAVEAFEAALRDLEQMKRGHGHGAVAHPLDAATRAKIELQKERIGQLLELARLGKRLLDALLSTAKVDAEPLVRFLLGAKLDANEP